MWKKNLKRLGISIKKKNLFFNVDQSSSVFKSIINNYLDEQKSKNKKKNNLIFIFDQKRRAVENKESEEDYLLKDLKKLRIIDHELINQYGDKAKEEYHDISPNKINIKMEKKLFLDGLDIKENNKTNYIEEEQEEKRFIHLPKIFHYKKNSCQLKKNYPYFRKGNSSIKQLQKTSTRSEKDLTRNKKKSLFNIKSYDGIFIQDNTITKNPIEQKYEKNKNNTKSMKLMKLIKKKPKKQINYIDTLNEVRKDFMKKERSYKQLFKSNDYGCSESNRKYHYMMQKYFEE